MPVATAEAEAEAEAGAEVEDEAGTAVGRDKREQARWGSVE